MNDYTVDLYKTVDEPAKYLTVAKWDNGFYFLPKLVGQWPMRENTFAMLEEIEIIVGHKIEHVRSMGKHKVNEKA